ncbi:cytolethal distending toxin subunit B family protein [Paludibacterium paludis]|uniref:Cytolethal distending toxin subunit CdtB n=1 Tax=Paludibacterium paludis TaxID=1225769 RepID=A0A918U762_9NEIS|nr:cytolethal distending toxin subunit B family protein [Paludibacterium paludis]GGY04260.1 cytolethal distending toxin subunit CdtB [Paludibacterium paludis]
MQRFLRFAVRVALPMMASCPVHADVKDFSVGSWNMQGASHATEFKWEIYVKPMARLYDVLALQETGELPAAAELTNRVIALPRGMGLTIREYTWRWGSHSRPGMVRYIYYADMGNRVSLATITSRRADDVVVLSNPAGANKRPLLGVAFNRTGPGGGRDVFFNIHARSMGNNEAPNIVDDLYRHFSGQANTEWMVLGDHNMEPNELGRLLSSHFPQTAREVTPLYTNNTATQISGGTLDYAVVGQGVPGRPSSARSMFARLHTSFLASNHSAVAFGKAE